MKLKLDPLTYLGFVFSKKNVCIDPQKVKAIQKTPTTEDKQCV